MKSPDEPITVKIFETRFLYEIRGNRIIDKAIAYIFFERAINQGVEYATILMQDVSWIRKEWVVTPQQEAFNAAPSPVLYNE